MSYSLNEVEATAKKAARGAGYPWGLAEEAAKATRWLCAHDIDGCAVLARVLQRFDGKDIASVCPTEGDGPWQAAGGVLCPIATGAVLSDMASDLSGDGIAMAGIAEPLFLLPNAAWAAERTGRPVTLVWPGGQATTDGAAVEMTGSADGVATTATIAPGGAVRTPRQVQTRARPDPAAWTEMNRFAHRTYAPATEASRLKGAGAGLSDND